MLTAALLVVAGIGAGLTGSIAGLASLVSYPALLATGMNPVSANVTNTVALVFSSLGSVGASRPELRGRRSRLLRLGIAAVLGGAAGGTLLLMTPPDTFAVLVPVLIGGASLAVLIPRPDRDPDLTHADPRWLVLSTFAIGVYGGYFGAAAGVLLLALLLVGSADSLPHANAMKNAVLGMANGVAALTFVVFGHVRWAVGIPLAIGLLLGGMTGPVVVRKVRAGPLRVLISLAGLGLAIKLGIDAY